MQIFPLNCHPENYDITWNNFESRLSRSFADIYSREQFLDVTLAADDENGSIRALRAHKVNIELIQFTIFTIKPSDVTPRSSSRPPLPS